MIGCYPPLWHPSQWDWSVTDTSLGLCLRYSRLTPSQRRIHDVEALSAPPSLLRLMPAATRAAHADPQFVATATGLVDLLRSDRARP